MAEFREEGDFAAGIQYAGAHYARKVAEAIEEEMILLVPVDTGELMESIHVEVVGETVYVKVGTGHWSYNEYGTSRMPARPFIRPPLQRRRNIVELGGTVF